ncbi:MarR family winged helix-turn-helix transcriptional regulator [Streptodolium elevatio]|uniref:MarR family winged helix-turn-helix transcriptional regulator n=1 Tax=Streptodolium elevatio TaxID=3157996 RepID=A0ABV3DPW8_9ACTN
MTKQKSDKIDAPLPPDELAARLAEVFALIGPLYRRAYRKVETSETIEGLSVGVRTVLEVLRAYDTPLTVPQIGRSLAVSRQFVQRTVNDAAALGYVECVPNPAHQRSSLIRLTDSGRAAVGAVLAREHDVLRQVGGELTAADLDSCVRVLTNLLALVDHVDVN